MKNQRPNFLLVMTDEHAPAVAGFSGDPIVQTQHLDQLSADGVHFRVASCTNPACTPSRMSMLTGKEPHRCAGWSNHWIIFPEHITWPQHFSEHGYTTGLVGKMHFGGKDQFQGFQLRPYGDMRHALGHQPDPLHMYPGYANPESAGITEIPESLLQDVIVTRETLALVLEQQDSAPNIPWFVCASYSRPHSPLTAPGRYIRRYIDKVPPPVVGPEASSRLEPYARGLEFDLTNEQLTRAREAYYASVDFVDDCIGELLDGLQQAGALENTIIIYTSDHGEMLGNYGCWGKCLYYEPSIGVPLVFNGPGLGTGRSIEHPISLMDLYPTTCGLAGIPVPEDLDGVDFSGWLSSPKSTPPPRTSTTSAFYRYGSRVEQGATPDDTPCAAWRCVRETGWKYVEVEQGAALLFDLANDPHETTNLAPNAMYRKRCERMQQILYENFSWQQVHHRLAQDRQRLPELNSGLPPGTPNQYMLANGRIFDAEKSMYDARWLSIPPGCTGGIIPQQFG